jgi:hypothetical protein
MYWQHRRNKCWQATKTLANSLIRFIVDLSLAALLVLFVLITAMMFQDAVDLGAAAGFPTYLLLLVLLNLVAGLAWQRNSLALPSRRGALHVLADSIGVLHIRDTVLAHGNIQAWADRVDHIGGHQIKLLG